MNCLQKVGYKCDFLNKHNQLVLRVDLGPLNALKGLINEVLASDPDKSYLRKEDRISQLTASNDVHKSAAIASSQTINENKSRFPKSFSCEGSKN